MSICSLNISPQGENTECKTTLQLISLCREVIADLSENKKQTLNKVDNVCAILTKIQDKSHDGSVDFISHAESDKQLKLIIQKCTELHLRLQRLKDEQKDMIEKCHTISGA